LKFSSGQTSFYCSDDMKFTGFIFAWLNNFFRENFNSNKEDVPSTFSDYDPYLLFLKGVKSDTLKILFENENI